MRQYTDPEAIGLRVKTPEEVQAILAELRRRLEALHGERLRGLYLYGSYVRGEAEAGSDLDVLAVLDRVESHWEETERTSHLRAELSLEHDVSLSLLEISEYEWRRGDSPFLSNVRREGKAA